MLSPCHDNVIILPIIPDNKTPSGLLLPKSEDTEICTGTVISVGSGIYEFGVLRVPSVKPGTQVLFSKYSGTKITDKGQNYLLLKDKDILAKEIPDPTELIHLSAQQITSILDSAEPIKDENLLSGIQNVTSSDTIVFNS